MECTNEEQIKMKYKSSNNEKYTKLMRYSW